MLITIAMLHELTHYFEHIPSSHRALTLAGGITFFWLVESAAPLFSFRYNKWKHAFPNLFFTITTIIINFAFAIVIVKISAYSVEHKTGILQWIHMPLWLSLVVGLMVLDFIGAYLVHYVEHKIKWMWRFHMVHHADTHVDTTTANRHHPGESVFRAVFTTLGVLVAGAPMWLVFLYQSLSVVLSQFNHANIRVPTRLDRVISWIIVSPNMHKIHHHYIRPETDTNYGNIFSLWDRILGTWHDTPLHPLQYGLDVLDNSKDEQLRYQLKLPFNHTIKTDY